MNQLIQDKTKILNLDMSVHRDILEYNAVYFIDITYS